jgi:hypothetical protein
MGLVLLTSQSRFDLRGRDQLCSNIVVLVWSNQLLVKGGNRLGLSRRLGLSYGPGD